MIAPPSPRLLLQDRPCQTEALKIKVPKEINLLPPKGHEMLTGVKTNKFGDVTYAKYKLVKPCTTIDGVWAMPEQIKVVPPKEKRRGHHQLFQRMRRSAHG